MRIVVDINHPAHVHYFKYFIQEMRKKGHEVLITASQKDITIRLLECYDLEYKKVGGYGKSLFEKMIRIPQIDFEYYLLMKKFNPDLLIGFGSIRAAHASFFLRKPCINFEDTEHSTEQIRLYHPFVRAICTPSCYSRDLGEKQVRFKSYMELASLHPKRFTPNPTVLAELGLTEKDPFIIVRFVSWQASHDVGEHGIRDKVGLVKALEKYGRVLITSERALPEELIPYRFNASPEKMHDLLHYATLYVGDGGTMAAEAAVLGTPSVFISSLAGGNFVELEKTYELLYNYLDDDTALKKAIEILQNPDSKMIWMSRWKLLMKNKIDLTAFMIWFIDNYPLSLYDMKENPETQNRFYIDG